jgi:hypothetical protein
VPASQRGGRGAARGRGRVGSATAAADKQSRPAKKAARTTLLDQTQLSAVNVEDDDSAGSDVDRVLTATQSAGMHRAQPPIFPHNIPLQVQSDPYHPPTSALCLLARLNLLSLPPLPVRAASAPRKHLRVLKLRSKFKAGLVHHVSSAAARGVKLLQHPKGLRRHRASCLLSSHSWKWQKRVHVCKIALPK